MNIHTTYKIYMKKIIVFARIIINGHGGVREKFSQKRKTTQFSIFSSRVNSHYVYMHEYFFFITNSCEIVFISTIIIFKGENMNF